MGCAILLVQISVSLEWHYVRDRYIRRKLF